MVALFLFVLALTARADLVGTNFLVASSTYSKDWQTSRALCAGENVFFEVYTRDYDVSDSDVWGQFVNPDGTRGSEISIDMTSGTLSKNAAVAYDRDMKQYAVVYEQSGAIYAVMLDATGTIVRAKFALDSSTCSNPDVVSTDDGDFYAVWEKDSAIRGVYFDETSLGATKQLAPVTSHKPKIAYLGNLFSTVVYELWSGSQTDIYARMVEWDGTFVGGPRVIADDPERETEPRIACATNSSTASSARCLVVYDYAYEGTGDKDIYGCIIEASTNGPITQITTVAIDVDPTTQATASVAWDALNNAYLVAYRTGTNEIWGRLVSADGIGGQKDLIAAGTNARNMPAVGCNSGLFLVTWHDFRTADGDIYGQFVIVPEPCGAVSAALIASAFFRRRSRRGHSSW